MYRNGRNLPPELSIRDRPDTSISLHLHNFFNGSILSFFQLLNSSFLLLEKSTLLQEFLQTLGSLLHPKDMAVYRWQVKVGVVC